MFYAIPDQSAVSLSVAALCYLAGLPFTCNGGIHLFTLFDARATISNIIIAFLQVGNLPTSPVYHLNFINVLGPRTGKLCLAVVDSKLIIMGSGQGIMEKFCLSGHNNGPISQ